MTAKNYLLTLLLVIAGLAVWAQEGEFEGYVDLQASPQVYSAENVHITPPKLLMEKDTARFDIVFANSDKAHGSIDIIVDDTIYQTLELASGKGTFWYVPQTDKKTFTVDIEEYRQEVDINPIPLWTSILAPLIAILLALVFREVVISIFLGIFVGAAIIGYYDAGSLAGIGQGFLDVISHYLVDAVADSSHVSILIFTLLIGGMVAIVSKNGGMQGIVNIIARMARTARSGQFATWIMGISIFFDDYANSLVVGKTMRPITDKLRISREKLAYIVDSTAAPVSALAFITTWIGAELGYIQGAIQGLADFPQALSPYSIFLSSLEYSFYPIFTLIFIVILIATGRDFGPMHKAERRARLTGQVSKDLDDDQSESSGGEDFTPLPEAIPRAMNALIPILVLITGVIAGLMYTGWDQGVWDDPELSFSMKLSTIIGQSDSYSALLWASTAGVIAALILTILQGFMTLQRGIETMITGFKAMLPALIILVLAWGLAQLTKDMATATYLVGFLGDEPSKDLIYWLPALTFLLAAAVAFATGSSWGTMAILYPVMLFFVWEAGVKAGMTPGGDELMPIFFSVVSAVLAGSVMGDHCSPISDTTILSSLASDCNHIDHVRTQLPYALTVGTIAMLIGTIPAAYGMPSYVTFPLGIAVMIGFVLLLGKKIETPKKAEDRLLGE